MQSPIPTTYGRDTHTQVWMSDNGLWDIARHDVYKRNGDLESRRFTLTDRRPGCTMYTIDDRFLAHTRHLLTIATTHKIPTPAYVCRAILKHCLQ